MPVHLSAEIRFAFTLPKTADVQREMTQAMKTSVEAIRRRAVQNLSGRFLRSRTGRGRNSVRTTVRATGDGVVGTVGSPAFYLRILHTGFGPQEMVVRKPGTYFTFVRGGEQIKTPSINHPGVAPRPWLQAALEESDDDIMAAFSRASVNIGRFVVGDGGAA